MVVGTPGRIVDIITKCNDFSGSLKSLEVLILDEADTVLEMGFRESINSILSVLPKQRRTGLFSATQTKEVRDLTRAGMRNPVSISVKVHASSKLASDGPSATPSTLSNQYVIIEHDRRPAELAAILQERRGDKVIVFCATCACVDFYGYTFRELSKDKGLSCGLDLDIGKVYSLHGKQAPKRRKAVYSGFVDDPTAVLFCTDVAARGIDIPDVDFIIQMAAPRDPAFFVHRVGRAARAGRTGQALIMLSYSEETYVELLKGRGVSLSKVESRAAKFATTTPTTTSAQDDVTLDGMEKDEGDGEEKDEGDGEEEDDDMSSLGSGDVVADSSSGAMKSNSNSNSNSNGSGGLRLYTDAFLEQLKALNARDRTSLEAGSSAFMAFLRGYKEHQCSYIFRFSELDLGAVARSYGLLRLPKIPETRVGNTKGKYVLGNSAQAGAAGAPIAFETTYIDTTKIPYKHKEKEKSRKGKLRKLKEAQREQERLLEQEEEEGGGLEIDGGSGSDEGVRTVKSRKSLARSVITGATGKTMQTQFTVASNGTVLRQKKAWVPAESYEKPEEKRVRVKKQSHSQRAQSEWDELAAEEAAYKKYKKGKMSKEEYETYVLDYEEEDGYDHNKVSLVGVKTIRGDDRAVLGLGEKKRKGGMTAEDEEELLLMEKKLKRDFRKQSSSSSSRKGPSSGASVKSVGTIGKKDFRKRKKGKN